MKVLVCGGRDFVDWTFFNKVMCLRFKGLKPKDLCIIQGGAKGADSLAENWADGLKIECLTFKADWDIHGRSAGPIRNQQMLDEGKPDLVIAFPGGRGTADMVSRAKKAGIPVEEIKYELRSS